MEFIEVLSPGLFTTIQDAGRTDYLQYGVSKSGVMDYYSFQIGNFLVGNELELPVLEVTMVGPKLKFNHHCVISITGGDLSPTINNKPIKNWRVYEVNAGDILTFGVIKNGSRAYIAINGGFSGEKVLGSYSTFTRGEYGGLKGRSLKKGDIVYVLESDIDIFRVKGRLLKNEYIPCWQEDREVRVIKGPQYKEFSSIGINNFLNHEYIISNDSDRMGFRLQGPEIPHLSTADIISDYIHMGTIQVPGNKLPIIHMADCGTSGGYTKIGIISKMDLPYVAQKKPGETLKFKFVEQEELELEIYNNEENLKNLYFINKTL